METEKKNEILEEIISAVEDFFEKEKISNRSYKINSELKKDDPYSDAEVIEIKIETQRKLIPEVKLFQILNNKFDEKDNYKLHVKLKNQKINFYFENSGNPACKWNKIEYSRTEKGFLTFLKKIAEYKNIINDKNYITVSFKNGYVFLEGPKVKYSFENGMIKKLEFKYEEQFCKYSVDGYENSNCDNLTYEQEKKEEVKINCEDLRILNDLIKEGDEMFSELIKAARKILELKKTEKAAKNT